MGMSFVFKKYFFRLQSHTRRPSPLRTRSISIAPLLSACFPWSPLGCAAPGPASQVLPARCARDLTGDLNSEATLPRILPRHCHHGWWSPETELPFWPCWLWPGSCRSESGWRAIFFGWRKFSWRVDVVERRWQLGQQLRPQYLCPGYTARCQTALTVGYC